jgi:hypothetical protein
MRRLGRFALWTGVSVGLVWCAAAGAQAPVGLWEFDNAGNLALATIGTNLTPNGSGFTAIGGIVGGDGAVAVDVGSYYAMTHGIAPNGGGTKVNKWTLLVDFRIPALGVWHAFFQTDAAPNLSDAEYFINTSGAIGVGALDYSNDPGNSGFLTLTDTWYRLVFVLDVPATGPTQATYHAYIDGSQIASLTAPAFSVRDQRFSPDPILLLFSDNDGEDGLIDVTNVAIWGEALGADAVASLGVAGDPITSGEGEGEGEGEVEIDDFAIQPVGGWFEVGQSLTLEVALASPVEPVTYRWQYYGEDIDPAETNSTLVFSSLEEADTGVYRCVVNDGSSKAEFISNEAHVLVVGAGKIPVGSVLGLSLLVGALALGGAVIHRRK